MVLVNGRDIVAGPAHLLEPVLDVGRLPPSDRLVNEEIFVTVSPVPGQVCHLETQTNAPFNNKLRLVLNMWLQSDRSMFIDHTDDKRGDMLFPHKALYP